MKFACPAKINLFLKVTGKRHDGFHELESLFAFVDLADELSVEKSAEFKLEISGEFANGVGLKENLFTKILTYFEKNFGVSKNLHVKIKKNIPVGAGLGGGSSDAAFFMKTLNEIFALKLSKEKLQEISLNFGSDIAFFFEENASIVTGRGEFIENYQGFIELDAILVNPRISLSTKEIFQKFGGNFSKEIPTKDLLQKNILQLLALPNDLEKPAISSLPVISEIITELKNSGAEFAKMSGSGATCFGIFEKNDLENAQEKLAKKFPGFFVRKIKILSHV